MAPATYVQAYMRVCLRTKALPLIVCYHTVYQVLVPKGSSWSAHCAAASTPRHLGQYTGVSKSGGYITDHHNSFNIVRGIHAVEYTAIIAAQRTAPRIGTAPQEGNAT